jgi:hypothetical protein
MQNQAALSTATRPSAAPTPASRNLLPYITLVLGGWFCNDGYVYIAPNQNGKITRIDTHNFTTHGVITLDLSVVNPGVFGLVSAFTDGKYGYFMPVFVRSGVLVDGVGKIARLDLGNFTLRE